VLGEAIVLCTSTGDATGVAEDEIREYLRGRLAAYKIPRVVLNFRESELSFTGNQKVQVGRLREAALERLQRDGVTIGGFRYAAPGS
jgi:acyl-CoA synthetase (AMP-forming)/AMP-acid ligase II